MTGALGTSNADPWAEPAKAEPLAWNEMQRLRSVPPPPDFTPAEPEHTTGTVQAAVEGAPQTDDDGRLEFLGTRFRLAERVGMMPLLAFANASKNGLDSDDMEGMAAMYALIRDVIDQTRVQKVDPETGEPQFDGAGEPVWEGPSEWQRFERFCMEQQAEGEELMEFIGRAMGVIAARPRKRREISSGSSPRTSPSSKAGSSSPVRNRPDLDGLTAVADLAR